MRARIGNGSAPLPDGTDIEALVTPASPGAWWHGHFCLCEKLATPNHAHQHPEDLHGPVGVNDNRRHVLVGGLQPNLCLVAKIPFERDFVIDHGNYPLAIVRLV